MSKFEETLKRTWDDVAKLEQQIETTLKSLLQDKLLEEADLIPLLDTKPVVSKATSSSNGSTTKSSSKRPVVALSSKKSKIDVGLSSSANEKQSKLSSQNEPSSSFASFALPTSTAPKKAHATTATPVNSSFLSRSTLSCLETDTFLLPVLDKWIFGATFVNDSSLAQKLPYVMLNLIKSGSGNAITDTSYNVLTYNFKSMLINVEDDYNFMENLNILPIQEALLGDNTSNKKDTYCVRPGSKFLVTVCFSHPVIASADKLSVIISLCSDGNQLWSKSIEINSRLALNSYDEEMVEKFDVQIFTALGQQTESFQLDNLGSRNIAKSFTDFLKNDLKLRKRRTVKTRFDMKIVTYCTTNMNFLWGTLIQVDICSNNPTSVQCSVSTRTPEQLRLVNALLAQWIMEKSKENVKIHASSLLVKNREELASETFHKEMRTLIHFLYLDYRKMFPGEWNEDNMEVDESSDTRGGCYSSNTSPDIFSRQSKTRVAVKWLRTYIKDLISTDNVFMHNVSN